MHLTYVAVHEVTWCMVVWCTQNAPTDGSSSVHVAPAAMLAAASTYTTSVDIQKRAMKKIFTHMTSAREWRTALTDSKTDS